MPWQINFSFSLKASATSLINLDPTHQSTLKPAKYRLVDL